MKGWIIIMLSTLSSFCAFGMPSYDERPIVPADANVHVCFQISSMHSNSSWSTGTVNLRGAITESMMKNEISRRYPNMKVRILSADYGKRVQASVQFQISRDEQNWSSGSVNLTNTLTESMMENEISRRYPNMKVRILSADFGERVQMTVRYQLSRDGQAWSGGTVTLTNALTESMARNQLSQRYPRMLVRILGLSR